jgi:hypothetical protein
MGTLQAQVHGQLRVISRGYLSDKSVDINDADNDGCTGVADSLHSFNFNWVCDVHDDFYQREFPGTRLEADQALFAFMCQEVRKQSRTPNHEMLGYVIAYRRYCFVRLFGWMFWRDHEGAASYWEQLKSCLLFWQ